MFNEGQLHGQWVVTDHRNKLVFSWEFTNGQRDGVSLWFSPAGHKILQVQYESNRPSGSMFQWNETDKKPPKEIALVRGMELKTETNWFEKTKKRKKEEVSFLIPSPMQAVEHEWDRSLVRYAKADDTQPLRHGEYKLWHTNGALAHTATYNLGEPSGAAQWWYANGQTQVSGQYASGQPAGPWTWWHENGMRKSSGHYQEGSQVGLWRTWTTRGELAASEQKTSLDTVTHYVDGNENELLSDALQDGENELQVPRISERGLNSLQ
jgi:antitoxin component YwqK of YwqJK toxin-antitoxin module